VPSCLLALKKGDVKAVVYDAPILHYYVKKLGPDTYETVGNLFQKNNYGFGLQNNSNLRESINRAMLRLNEMGVIDELKSKWFGTEQ
jgi:ABC-type amino acid transport substrate-binding protein